MKPCLCLIALGWAVFAANAPAGSTLSMPAPAVAPDATAVKIVASANAFLATLNDAQRTNCLYDFKNEEQRARWSNLPTGLFHRAGLRMGDLSNEQRAAAMQMLAASLSGPGYEKTTRIIEAEEALKHTNHPASLIFGADEFYVSILGVPSASAPWMLQFGGHHLALNITIVGDQDVLTPSLIAVQPASYTSAGQTIRPLGRENDKAFALIHALDDAQRKQAILDSQVRDLVLGPGRDGRTVQPEGLKASGLTETQQKMLLDLISEWVGIINDRAAAAKLAEVKQHLSETWFAWSGSTESGHAAYFRIQGPTLVIEYAPQSVFGDATQHIHTIYRDPTNDYGRNLLKP